MGKRAKKGSVVIDSRNGMLRLRLPRTLFDGKQKYISLGLPDTAVNRKIAEAKVGEINIDILLNQFDFSFDKYLIQSMPTKDFIDLIALYDQYMAFKSKHLTKGSMKNYTTVKHKLETMPSGVIEKPSNIKAWLLEHNSQEQARRVLVNLSGCLDWAVENELIGDNPFKRLKKIKAVKNHTIDPFSVEERDFIIECFNQSEYFAYYSNFVRFLFFTGCRPSEAIALEWKNVNRDYIFFTEAIVEREWQNHTKTRKSRKFPINEQLSNILNEVDQESDFVFVAKEGGVIDLHNFTNRAWRNTLKGQNIRYRPPYNCRHTFITLCLDAGVPIQQVANWVGNSPAVILKHYAGLTRSNVPLI